MDAQLVSMCDWERKKAIYILNFAENTLNMDISGYGQLAVNPNSGYTYLWVEDYPFTLFMPISCKLQPQDIDAIWTNIHNGEERYYSEDCQETINDVDALYKWCEINEKDASGIN